MRWRRLRECVWPPAALLSSARESAAIAVDATPCEGAAQRHCKLSRPLLGEIHPDRCRSAAQFTAPPSTVRHGPLRRNHGWQHPQRAPNSPSHAEIQRRRDTPSMLAGSGDARNRPRCWPRCPRSRSASDARLRSYGVIGSWWGEDSAARPHRVEQPNATQYQKRSTNGKQLTEVYQQLPHRDRRPAGCLLFALPRQAIRARALEAGSARGRLLFRVGKLCLSSVWAGLRWTRLGRAGLSSVRLGSARCAGRGWAVSAGLG